MRPYWTPMAWSSTSDANGRWHSLLCPQLPGAAPGRLARRASGGLQVSLESRPYDSPDLAAMLHLIDAAAG